MASNKLFQRYLWLVDTIYSAGSITRDEIDRRWVHSAYNDAHESQYGERNFHRHREAIFEIFGIDIVCNHTTKRYYIENLGDLRQTGLREQASDAGETLCQSSSPLQNCKSFVGGPSYSSIRAWLIDTFAINNMVNLAGNMKDRILFEPIPEGSRYLSSIVSAMKEEKRILLTYQRFNSPEPHSFLLDPYCLKVFKQRWYLIGKSEDHPEEHEPRVYALDRVKDIAVTDKEFKIPRNFKASRFFEGYFGVDRRIQEPARILIKMNAKDAPYLRTLPIHGSQFELEKTEEFSIFGFYVAPTYDFIQELRKHGANLEVLEPEELREKFREEHEKALEMYTLSQ